MSDRPGPIESAPAPASTVDDASDSTAKKPRAKGRPRKGTQSPQEASDPDGSGPVGIGPEAEAVIARTRKLLERLIRTAGYGWREVDRMIHKNRGFTAHLLFKREGLPLNEVLAILDAIDIPYEDFFAVLFPKLDKPRIKKPVGEGMLDLLSDLDVPEVREETEAERDEQSRAIWNRLGRITAMIDQRVLTLMESALGEPLQLPPRPPARPAEAAAEGDGDPPGSSTVKP